MHDFDTPMLQRGVFLKFGFEKVRQKGSHVVMKKNNIRWSNWLRCADVQRNCTVHFKKHFEASKN